jgi:hypothetical protein
MLGEHVDIKSHFKNEKQLNKQVQDRFFSDYYNTCIL